MSRRRYVHRSRGFALVSAIFLLVVLAALGAFIAVVSTTQQIGSALDLQGAKAYQAARAGIEWGSYQVWALNPARNTGACPAATSFGFPTVSANTARVLEVIARLNSSGFRESTNFTVRPRLAIV